MQFTMLEYGATIPSHHGAYLTKDNWNDYGFWTLFDLQVRLSDGGAPLRFGFVRIAHVSMETGGVARTADLLPPSFQSLDSGFFSLAQEDDYYENLRTLLPPGMYGEILHALKDVAYIEGLSQQVSGLRVFRDSLLRDHDMKELRRKQRVARGTRRRIVPFKWSYTPPQAGLLPPHNFEFETKPWSLPSTNLHALIGRNGVGKSRLLHAIATEATAGRIAVESDSGGEDNSFTRCVVVSFSPFDELYKPPPAPIMKFDYIGLRHQEAGRLKSDEERTQEFADSFAVARIGARGERWRKAIGTLNYAASGFLDGHMDVIDSMMREGSPRRLTETMSAVFNDLSSGHKVALLMVTRLIEVVGERTLVLIDEPETHLHPPLLSALTRALSDLVADRNGMALVATHSPVVLQEVPATCVWKMIRNGDELTAHRPGLETYGESVGELTHDVFGLEVTSSGFHATIAQQVETGATYEDITARFSGLGSEARALLRAMTYGHARRRR
ncbi:ATP-binding protein [Streptomyces sp. BI87]|uniref:ATP-binding protein n=1 Tax=Streptomyces sp. BI87 TaxID=2987521 RepID=UPI0022217F31|nr:ATP-binding protein [Streptomyces sp. BI87]UYX96149.1 ATP-binding protein [Streptomyces sp. BI87]